jgi:hypothetical protein
MSVTHQYIEALEAYLARSGASLVRLRLPDWVHGRVRADLITVRADLPPEQELLAVVHEITHWLAHREVGPSHCRTLFEYEAEAVEQLVMAHLGLPHPDCAQKSWHEHPTDDLLAASVTRVTWVTRRILAVLGIDSEAQAPVDLQAAPREEIVFEYELHGVGDFFGLPQAL